MRKIKFFKDPQERSEYILKMNDANSQRVILVALFMLGFMIFELIRDSVEYFHDPASAQTLCGLKFFGHSVNFALVFALIELIVSIFSIAILIIGLGYKKNQKKGKTNNQLFFCYSIQIYGTIILFISAFSILADASTYLEVDFNLFYLISLVCVAIFYMDSIVLIPEILISNGVLWFLILKFNWGQNFLPYLPYCAFIVVDLCLCSIFRSVQLLRVVRREDQIKKLQAEAEKENQLKSLFLANMSHEIRTPMNAIVGMSELALDFNLQDSEKNTIRQIRSSGLALVNIINDILDFSKIESGKMEIVPVKYDLLKMIYDGANVAKVKLAGKEVELRIEMEEELYAFYNGDDLRLRQILINLVGNAAKFTEEGYVIIRVESLKKFNPEKDGLRFSVIDSGCGIREEDLKKLFNAFQQVDMKMNRTKGGTGLGLSISKRLVQLMGGSMGVDSVYGKGSCFYFDVPQKNESDKKCKEVYAPVFEASEENQYHKELRNLSLDGLLNRKEFACLFAERIQKSGFICPKAKILVVDDNEVNLQVACGLLKKFGVAADTASSGMEALEKLGKTEGTDPYNIVFMDHQMPVMDGVETLEKLRQREKEKNLHTVVVALSANAVNSARQMFLSKGFDDFVAKPVQSKDFGECLKKWLPVEFLEENSAEEKAAETEVQVTEGTDPQKISGINLKTGRELCGGKENWINLAKTFSGLVTAKAELMENLLVQKDFKNYSIEVHALKSSAKVIGAEELSSKAKELEFLSKTAADYVKNGDSADNKIFAKLISEIEDKSSVLVELYRKTKISLEALINSEGGSGAEKNSGKQNKPSAEALNKIFEELKAAAENNDLSGAEELINQLDSLELPEKDKNLVEELKTAVQNIDFENLLELLNQTF